MVTAEVAMVTAEVAMVTAEVVWLQFVFRKSLLSKVVLYLNTSDTQLEENQCNI
jgi:hypothetical protein